MSLAKRWVLLQLLLVLALGLLGSYGLQRLSEALREALADTAGQAGQGVAAVVHERMHEFRRIEAGDVDGLRALMTPGAGGRSLPDEALQELQRLLAQPSTEDVQVRVITHRAVRPDGVEPEAGLQLRTLVLRSEGPVLRVETGGASALIPLDLSSTEAAVQQFTARLALGLALLLGVALLLGAWMAHRVGQPLRALADGAARIGAGERGVQIADHGVAEVRSSVDAFNRMAAELERLDAEAQRLRGQQALVELGEIGRGLAHALRSPLHALGLALEALEAQARDSARASELAGSAREQLARLDGSLRGFLALAASQDAPVTAVALNELATDVVLETRQGIGRHCDVELDIEPGLRLQAVETELRILLQVLVGNAAEASPPGGQVTLRMHGSAPLQVEVLDRGCGVPEALRGRLFEPHVSSKPHGAGMGLYLSRRLAELRYRGRLELHARDGGGSIARLELWPRA